MKVQKRRRSFCVLLLLRFVILINDRNTLSICCIAIKWLKKFLSFIFDILSARVINTIFGDWGTIFTLLGGNPSHSYVTCTFFRGNERVTLTYFPIHFCVHIKTGTLEQLLSKNFHKIHTV